jgi:hypothetical protein
LEYCGLAVEGRNVPGRACLHALTENVSFFLRN